VSEIEINCSLNERQNTGDKWREEEESRGELAARLTGDVKSVFILFLTRIKSPKIFP
jgi:hypothetical protein